MVNSLEKFSLVAADVDGTLTKDGQRPAEMVELLATVARERSLALISGSSYQALEKKIVRDLAATGAEFDVYASGGSVRFNYKGGQATYDPIHGGDVMLPLSQVEEVRHQVQLAVRKPEMWDIGFLEMFSQWANSRQEGIVPGVIQNWRIRVTRPGEIDPESAIRVEARRDPLEKRVVGLSIKSIPRTLGGKTTYFVNRLADKLRQTMEGRLQIIPAGFASIDVNMGNGSKAEAIKDLIQRLGILPSQILYFGDEFGVHGNDRAVEKAGVTNIVDVSNGGPELTAKVLKAML